MNYMVQAPEEAHTLAIAFIQQEEAYKKLLLEEIENYSVEEEFDVLYDLKWIKSNENGWLLHFWRRSNQKLLRPLFITVEVNQSTGEVKTKVPGLVLTRENAITLAKGFLEEVENYRDEYLKERYREKTFYSTKWNYTLRDIKEYQDGWLVQLNKSAPGVVVDPSDSLVYVYRKTGETELRRGAW